MVMEPAVRVFAAEYNASKFTREDRRKKGIRYVITPGGAWCHRIFIVGAVTSIEHPDSSVVEAYVGDPTGSFQLLAAQSRSDIIATLGMIEPPAFVAVSGMAHMYLKGSKMIPVIRPDMLNIVEREVRDTWVLRTAELSLERLEILDNAISNGTSDERIAEVLDFYGPNRDRIKNLARNIRTAVETVKTDYEGEDLSAIISREVILRIVQAHGNEGISRPLLIKLGVQKGLTAGDAESAIDELVDKGECYSPKGGLIKSL